MIVPAIGARGARRRRLLERAAAPGRPAQLQSVQDGRAWAGDVVPRPGASTPTTTRSAKTTRALIVTVLTSRRRTWWWRRPISRGGQPRRPCHAQRECTGDARAGRPPGPA